MPATIHHHGRTCAGCAWLHPHGSGFACVAADSAGERVVPLAPTTPGCDFFEPVPRCEPCGACCREAFDAAPIEPEDLAIRAHPALVVQAAPDFAYVARVPCAGGTRCAALTGDGVQAPFRCQVYANRPTACRDLVEGSVNCLLARRIVGLSPTPPGQRLPGGPNRD